MRSQQVLAVNKYTQPVGFINHVGTIDPLDVIVPTDTKKETLL